MSITIYSSGGTLKYTFPALQASRLHQSLNGECLFDFTMPGRMISGIAIGDQVRLGDLWFYVCRIGKQTMTAGAEFSVSCEHVSYSLADVEQEAAHFSGTPAAVLSTILAGTGFSAGTVTVSGEWSITINKATNKRDALQQWAAECGAEISYSGMSINFLSRIGSSVPVLLSDAENVKGLSVTLDSRSNTQTYAVEMSRLQTLGLGDAVTIRYSTLDLDVTTRVINLNYDPFHPWIISMTTGDYVPNFTGAVSAALEARLKEGQPYFGVTIDQEHGIQIARSDGQSDITLNSDLMRFRGLVDGQMLDQIYFDPTTGRYIFNGALGADAIFTDSLYAEQGDVAELTVDRLSTSARIRKYILGDTSDDNYIRIQDQYLQFVTGTLNPDVALMTEDWLSILTEDGDTLLEDRGDGPGVIAATNRYGQPLYWRSEPVSHTDDGYPLDDDGYQIYATTEETDWPVYVYAYTEEIKAEYAFAHDGEYYVPQIVLGAGDEHGYSKAYFAKSGDGLNINFVDNNGQEIGLKALGTGYLDLYGLRKTTVMDFSEWENGQFSETVDGGAVADYGVVFDGSGRPVKITDASGHETVVVW